MGTPVFALASLDTIIKRNPKDLRVVTQPDRPKGRGKKLGMPPMKKKALEHGLEIYQPSKLKDPASIDLIKNIKPDLIVVVAYGQILPKEIIHLPPLGCINIHASLLPKYRGAAPINWAIIKGEKTTGITSMYMDEGLDTGDIILQEEIPIGDNETAGELHDRLSIVGAGVLEETLNLLQAGELATLKQDDDQSSYAPMMTKDLGEIGWEKPAKEIHNLIRGTIPWPMPYTYYKNKRMRIWESRIINHDTSGKPGTILKVLRDEILVATGEGVIAIRKLQFSGRKKLKVEDYLIGNKIEKEIRLGLVNGKE